MTNDGAQWPRGLGAGIQRGRLGYGISVALSTLS